MERAEITEGKERVRTHLIEPLEADGMVRVAKTVAEHETFLGKVQSALCYMTEAELVSLCETIARGASECSKCRRKSGWPALVLIRNWAHDLRPRPDGDSPKTTSWLRSSAGQRCWLECATVAVAARKYLRKFPGVPTDQNGGMTTVRTWADRWRRDLSVARERIDAGTANEGDRGMVDGFERAKGEVHALVWPDGEVRADAA